MSKLKEMSIESGTVSGFEFGDHRLQRDRSTGDMDIVVLPRKSQLISDKPWYSLKCQRHVDVMIPPESGEMFVRQADWLGSCRRSVKLPLSED